MIFVNFKTYKESTGDNGLRLIRDMEEVAATTSIPLIPVVQVVDLGLFRSQTKLPLWVQHVDSVSYGAHTGFTLPEEVKALGAVGTFLNHSEHKLNDIAPYQEAAKREGLKTLIFAANMEELSQVLALKPDYVSYEPPELVGSTTTSVSEAKPEVIEKASNLSQKENIPLIVGAGIHSMKDVSIAKSLGAAGIAVATNIVKADDPKAALRELLTGFI